MTKHERTDHYSNDVFPCDGCGKLTHIDQLDAKDDGSNTWEILQCKDCYGPGWAPAVIPASNTGVKG